MSSTTGIPYEKITSILSAALSDASSITSVLATATVTEDVVDMQRTLGLKEASLSYYSLLEVLATATETNVVASAASQTATASAVMHEAYTDLAYLAGHKPSFGGNLALLIVFAVFLGFHAVAGVMSKQWWFMVCWILGLAAEVIGYAGRVMLHGDIFEFNSYIIQMVTLTIAPCFLLAGIYYLLAQLTVVMGARFSKLKPMQYSMIFVMCDFIAIVIQAIGGAKASSSDSDSSDMGGNIMVGGLAFQVLAMSLFQFFWYDFLYKCYKEQKHNMGEGFNKEYAHVRSGKHFQHLLWAISLAVLFIFIRSIYRLIELIEGFSGTLATVEIYFMTLEALMVAIATLILTVVYPGFIYGRKTRIVVKKGFSKKNKDTEGGPSDGYSLSKLEYGNLNEQEKGATNYESRSTL